MADSVSILLAPPRSPILARLGEAMRRHRRFILAIQWTVVAVYLVLLTLPAFAPLPPSSGSILSNLTLFAQFAFWGIWWPFVMLSMMLVGRVWCGVLCPEGALSEWVSRHGLGKSIPRWIRWSGWPFVAFLITTVYGQLVSVYEYPKAALLVLGGSTAAAVVIGFLYGKGKRVWCRHLCPANGVFALLAKIAPLHFRTNEVAWKRFPGRADSVDCAPLVDLRHLQSASQCHACGRCAGHRGAIELAVRPPNHEILSRPPNRDAGAAAVLLIFGVLGVATGAFQWTLSPWFVAMKLAAAEWLIARDSLWLLQANAPWWILTHYPEASDVFTWLDGLTIIAYISGTAIVVGTTTLIALLGAQFLAGCGRYDWKSLAMTLIPLAGISIFLGLSMLTLTQLRAEGVTFAWLEEARAALLLLGLGWSGWLGARVVLASPAARLRRLAALAVYALPLALLGSVWYLAFYVW
ncbi:MAG: 4Fe-4S binding protein [Betaproteobacteria bacterium]|nr:4Fe-4S binding protein [Betaproteobacteria bacterium]